MKRIILLPITLLTLLTIVSLPLFADNYYYPNNSPAYGSYVAPISFAPPSHFVIGAQIGIGGIQTPADPTYDYYNWGYSDSINDQTFATFNYRAYLGYLFTVTPRFQIGPEVAYWGYGENSYSYTTYDSYYYPNGNLNINYSGYSIEYLLAMKYYVLPRLSITGQVGAATVSQTLETQQYFNNTANITTTSTTASETLPDFGIGFAYDLGPNFSINMTYDYIFGNNLVNVSVIPPTNLGELCGNKSMLRMTLLLMNSFGISVNGDLPAFL
jgi:hypothetical protein